jgi:hypothetical protein
MYQEYVEYQDNIRKHNLQQYGLVWWSFLLAIFVLVTVIATVAVLPMGIIIGILCFFYLRFVIKRWKKCRETWKKIKAYRSAHKRSVDIRGNTTYCFVVPFPTHEALDAISGVLTSIGEINSVDSHHGVVRGKIRISSKKKESVTFYVKRNNERCNVRACFSIIANDEWWDLFLNALFEKYPDVDFGVSLALGDPVVSAVLDLSGGTQEVYSSTTRGGTSLAGFLIGGALFGDAGAIVGGLSGKQRTITNSRTVFSNEFLVRIIYSNGRLWEGSVIKGSQLYNEIMVLAM